MVAVTSADLTFLPWEVAELFADVYEDPIEPVAVEALTERTEGWAAALRLWHLARRLGQQTLIAPPENPSPNALGGLPECLHDYVDREVLAGLPDPLLRFAQAMSVFDAVTPERADRMLGTTGSRRALGDLARRVQLIVPMGEVDSYRFHRVLREHLRAGLAVDHGTNALRAMFDEAAVVLTAEGAHAEAFRARCRGGNAAEAAHLVVVNHALMLADLATEAQVLPEYDHIIIDEAHNLEEVATDQFGFTADQARLIEFLDSLFETGGVNTSAGLFAELPKHFQHSAAGQGDMDKASAIAQAAGPAVTRARQSVYDLSLIHI